MPYDVSLPVNNNAHIMILVFFILILLEKWEASRSDWIPIFKPYIILLYLWLHYIIFVERPLWWKFCAYNTVGLVDEKKKYSIILRFYYITGFLWTASQRNVTEYCYYSITYSSTYIYSTFLFLRVQILSGYTRL